MKKENKFYSILTTISDWVLKVITLNVLVISFSLLIVTIIPAFTAGYKLFADYLNKDEEGMFKGFFKYFKENLINKIILSVGVVLVIVGLVISNLYYQGMMKNSRTIISYIGFVITLIMLIATVITTIYLPVVLSTDPSISIEESIKGAFYLAIKFIFRSIVCLLIMILPAFLLLSSYTTLILAFCGISLPLLSITIITTTPKKYFIKLREEEHEIRN